MQMAAMDCKELKLEFFLHQSEVPLPRYGRKPLFVGFEIGFTAFAVQILALWGLFCVDLSYRCQENLYLMAYKPFLRHSPFYF